MSRIAERALAAAAVLACAAALLWVVEGVADLESRPGYAGHYYEFLVDGFRSGHTSLSVAPSPELARLRDPYDPAQNARYRLADASYYAGRYYLYYGPTPAVALMLPWRILTGTHLPERRASVLFSLAALVGLGLLLSEIRARHFPSLPAWSTALLLVVAFHAAWLPVLLRRPGFWELPHASALACLWWSLYFLWRCRIEPGRLLWPAALGVALVLLLGSRPTFFFAAAAMAVLALVPARIPGAPAGARLPGTGALAALALPLLAGGVALVAYNVARFGSPMEFGQSYQLLNADQLRISHFRPGYLGFNFWIYLAAAPEWSPYFPFVRTVMPAELPPGYLMTEEMHSCLFAVPIQLAGLVALAWLLRRRGAPGMGPLAAVVGAGALASVFSAAVLFSWFGASTRYITELAGGWTLAALVGLMALFDGAPSPRTRILRVAAAAAAAWTLGYVWLASFEHGGLFRSTNPGAYDGMARVLDTPSLWVARARGIAFGPAEIRVRLSPYRGPEKVELLWSGRQDMMNRLVLRRLDPQRVSLALEANDTVVARLDPVPVEGDGLTVRVEAPWLYPPAEHPYWDRFRNPAERRDRSSRFSVAAAGLSAVAYSGASFDPASLEPRTAAAAAGRTAWVESFRFLSSRAP